MPCVHLQQLFQLCADHEIKLASSDLIHIVCTQCDEKEVCPSVLTDEYDASQPAANATEPKPSGAAN